MSTVLKQVTPAEYLARERAASVKSEYFKGEMFATAGGSPNHSLIAANFIGETRQSLKDRPCEVFSSDMRIKVEATSLYTYPDATIVCGDLEFDDEVGDTVVNPTVIVEVLSESTEKYDRGRKSNHYRQIASLKELILISQDQHGVEIFARQDSGGWLLHETRALDELLELKSLGVSIAMSEIYRNVTRHSTVHTSPQNRQEIKWCVPTHSSPPTLL